MRYAGALKRLTSLSRSMAEAANRKANDGTALFVTNGAEEGDALWTRDFGYMMESCSELLGMDRVESCIDHIFRAARVDGFFPDCVETDGEAVYAAGVNRAPVGMAALDTASFAVSAVSRYLQMLPQREAKRFFLAWEPALMRALCAVPVSPKGLVQNDATNPHLCYGYAGGAMKTGQLFLESLLLWRGMRQMEAIQDRFDLFSRDGFILRHRAETIEKNLRVLFEENSGVFFAADGFCRQADIWGMLYALYAGFPLQKEIRQALVRWLLENRHRYMTRGRVSRVPDGEAWERYVKAQPQEGGLFESVASGWALAFFHREDPAFAEEMLRDLLEDLEGMPQKDGAPSGSAIVGAGNLLHALQRIEMLEPEF